MNEEIELLRSQMLKLQEENKLLREKVGSLEQGLQDAVEISEKKNTLISQISHEIRTPLNVVIGMAGIAKEELDNPNKVRDNLSEIANSSRILLGIVDNILDVSDLASGKLQIDSNKFDLKEEIATLGMHFYENAKYKDVHFDIHIKGVSEEYLIGDERRLQQIMTNLFNNALKVTPSGGKIELTVLQGSSSRNRVYMRFILQDTGRGIPVSVVDDLFLPYAERQNVDTHMYTDSGISLFAAKQLAQALGGTIQVDSHLGEGNRVIVDIPFKKTEQQKRNMSAITGHRFLIVADEEVCKDRAEMLEDMGISYEMATDGYQALDQLGKAESDGKAFDVCMVDMNMKKSYPDALIIEMRKIFGKMPIIIATTYNQDVDHYKKIGADYIIDNALFRSTIFDALMKLEKGKLHSSDEVQNSAYGYDFSGKRILVVEDILLNMEVIVKLLGKVNAAVVCAENGKEALQTYLRKPAGYFDCILMDVNMPVMGGYEATRQIRNSGKEDASSVAIYAMTANAFSEDIAESLKAGMNGHIAKPVDVRLLYKTLNKQFYGFDDEEMANQLLKRAEKLEKQNTKLKEQAEHDPLTGLYNRYAYEKETYSLMCKKEPVGFVLLDIDHFKEINDVYGHEIGDAVLKKVADTLKNNVRSSDFVVRLGGDEFAIILREYGDQPEILYDKVVDINRKLLHSEDGMPGVTLSAGAAFSDIGYTTELYGNADKALYKTKKEGRNGCTIFDENNWSEYDELEKKRHNLSEYLKFSFDGRPNMGEMISLRAYRLLEYSLKVRLENTYGARKQKELFREAGFDAGVYLAEEILDKSLKLDAFIKQLADTLEELRIGYFVLEQMDEMTGKAIISVYEDADCSGVIPIGESICHYDEGMIAGVLSVYTSQRYSATEIECWAKGDLVCRFEAKPIKV